MVNLRYWTKVYLYYLKNGETIQAYGDKRQIAANVYKNIDYTKCTFMNVLCKYRLYEKTYIKNCSRYTDDLGEACIKFYDDGDLSKLCLRKVFSPTLSILNIIASKRYEKIINQLYPSIRAGSPVYALRHFNFMPKGTICTVNKIIDNMYEINGKQYPAHLFMKAHALTCHKYQ